MKINAIYFPVSVLFLMTFCGASALTAQSPANPAPAAASTSPVAAPALKAPSAILQPALDTVQQTIELLRPEKWKGPGEMRGEASANIDSIRRDLKTTLPPLLAAADAVPSSVAKVLPAYRNIEALYDVLLRVTEAGRFTSPDQQREALEDAMARLEAGRRALGEQLQSAAVAREQEVQHLQAAIQARPPAPPPAACPPPPEKKKRKTRKKSVKKHVPASTPGKPSTPQ
jgi:hypothetical protein